MVYARDVARLLPWLLVLLVAACDSDTRMDPGQGYLYDRARTDARRVKEGMATGANPTFDCSTVEQAVHELATVRPPIADLKTWEKLCALDAPLAYADALVKRLEATRPVEDARTDDCVELDRAIDRLDLSSRDQPQVKTLHAKRKQLCP
jgi:hypothetical protein